MAASLVAALLVCNGCGADQGAADDRRLAARKVSWARAQSLLNQCKVTAVEQTHGRVVTLTLRDGSMIWAHEPRIDEVVQHVVRLQRRCGPIRLAME